MYMSQITVLGGDKLQEKFMILHDILICTKERSKYNGFPQRRRLVVSMQVKMLGLTGPLPSMEC